MHRDSKSFSWYFVENALGFGRWLVQTTEIIECDIWKNDDSSCQGPLIITWMCPNPRVDLRFPKRILSGRFTCSPVCKFYACLRTWTDGFIDTSMYGFIDGFIEDIHTWLYPP